MPPVRFPPDRRSYAIYEVSSGKKQANLVLPSESVNLMSAAGMVDQLNRESRQYHDMLANAEILEKSIEASRTLASAIDKLEKRLLRSLGY